MLNPNTNFFQSRDLYFSSFLLATNHDLQDLSFDNLGGFFWFVFEDKDECEKLEKLFQFNKLTVNAKDMVESIKYLKRRISK